MFNCEYCGKELKSKGGKTMHERSCSTKDAVESVIEELAELPTEEVIKPTSKVVELEVLGTGGQYPDGKDNNYYEGHPRREIKLRGLLSRTRDDAERSKIMKMIMAMK